MITTCRIGPIKDLIKKSQHQIVAIDGAHGVGKTTFGRRLVERLGNNHASNVHVDQAIFKCKNRPKIYEKYQEILDYHWLKKFIDIQITEYVIIDGICVRDVLGKIDLHKYFCIYVKKIGKRGSWNEFLDDDYSGLVDASVKEYHNRTNPQLECDAIYEWKERDCCIRCGEQKSSLQCEECGSNIY